MISGKEKKEEKKNVGKTTKNQIWMMDGCCSVKFLK